MRLAFVAGMVAMVGVAGCGLSPEEQRAADQQGCIGYGFTPGTDAFAHCMMTTAQQRSAQEAAAARQRAAANAEAQQREQDRAAADARAAAQRAQSQSSSSSMDTSMPDMPSFPSMPSNMVCTGSQGINAGSMNCHSP